MPNLGKVPWIRVAAEFLAIFAGVTLSLAADDWRQDRIDRQLESEILRELSADLQTDSAHLDAIRARLADFDTTGIWLMQRLDRSEIDPDTVVARFKGFFNHPTYEPVTSAYMALKEGGQMALIRDLQIRRQIVDYYELGRPRMLAMADRLWGVYSDLRLVFHRHFIWELPDMAKSFSDISPSPPFRFQTSWDLFRSDPQTVSVLGRMVPDAMSWSQEIAALQRDNSLLHDQIPERFGDS